MNENSVLNINNFIIYFSQILSKKNNETLYFFSNCRTVIRINTISRIYLNL